MYIYNTTFHVDYNSKDSFLKWIREYYVSKALEGGKLRNPQLVLIMAKNEGDNGESYSLQFTTNSIEDLEEWYKMPGKDLVNEMINKFDKKVMGFSTIMQILEL